MKFYRLILLALAVFCLTTCSKNPLVDSDLRSTEGEKDSLILNLKRYVNDNGKFNLLLKERGFTNSDLKWSLNNKLISLAGETDLVTIPLIKNSLSRGFVEIKLLKSSQELEVHLKGYDDNRDNRYIHFQKWLLNEGYSTLKLRFSEGKVKFKEPMFFIDTESPRSFNDLSKMASSRNANKSSANTANCNYQLSGHYYLYYNHGMGLNCEEEKIRADFNYEIMKELARMLNPLNASVSVGVGPSIAVSSPFPLQTSNLETLMRQSMEYAKNNVQCIHSLTVLDVQASGFCKPNIVNPGPTPNPSDYDGRIGHELDDYPCAVDLLDYFMQSNQKISQLLNSTFGGTQTKVNMTFHSKQFADPNYDGGKRGGYSIYDAHIDISEFVLQNSTKEYQLTTMYHEMWHAYLEVEKYRLGSQTFAVKYPEIIEYNSPYGTKYVFDTMANHNRFNSFINLMKSELKLFNPTLPDNVIDALVTTGLFENRTPQDIMLNNAERDIRTGNSKGKKCN